MIALATEVVIAIVTMEEAVGDLVVESALSVVSQDILLGNVQVKGLEGVVGMVAGMTGMAVVVVVVAVLGLIGMEIDMVDATGKVVAVGEVIVIVVTGLDHMTVGVMEVTNMDEMAA